MIIEKRLIVSIDTNDAKIIYAPDHNAAIIELLKTKYKNRCFKNCFIIDIARIIERSPMVCEYHRSGGHVKITVSFVVRAIIYDQYETIPDAQIAQIMESGNFILKSKYAAIALAPNPKLQHLKVGQIIPVRVVRARYIPHRDKISVQGIPFIPMITPVDEVLVSVQKEDIDQLSGLKSRIAEEQKKISEMDSKKIALLKEIMYPYKEVKMPKSVSIWDLKGTVTISRPDSLDPFELVCVARESKEIKKDDLKDAKETPAQSPVVVLKGYLNTVLKNLTALRSLAEIYTIDASTKPIWQIYISEKK